MASPPTVWLIHDGAIGNAVQSEGLAAALGLKARTHIVAPPVPYRWLAPWGPPAPMPEFTPPWPDIALASCRQAVPYLRRLAKLGVFTVCLKTPRIDPATFDLVWVPAHDRLTGANVISTAVSPHTLTAEKLASAAADFAGDFATLPPRRLGVVIGGSNGVFTLGAAQIDRLAADLAALAQTEDIGFIVTPSRRTGSANITHLRAALKGLGAYVWDFKGANPYHALLAHADWLLVSCDSANMVGEAAFTGKPVYMLRLPGGSAKFSRFHDRMIATGAVRWFEGELETWPYEPLDATGEIAEAIRAAFETRTGRKIG
ncbi:DUF1022 domain-containing protein [hydrothermal vent metagenome]|uniref:DUF1022 domain-containing protein n=1 Tax=hydrothermal vent metagenome TaxID=652676 RepID=A0A3B0U0P8_9ZZZZ